jgi:uncharacterized membrane protein
MKVDQVYNSFQLYARYEVYKVYEVYKSSADAAWKAAALCLGTVSVVSYTNYPFSPILS